MVGVTGEPGEAEQGLLVPEEQSLKIFPNVLGSGLSSFWSSSSMKSNFSCAILIIESSVSRTVSTTQQ